jgi:two-component system, OmpR family, phosphate regulon sensor histidine kinase PhoR
MTRRLFADKSLNRLRLALVVFFFALAIPTGMLLRHSYSQLKWEAFHRHRLLAEELVARIDQRYTERIERENARAFTDYTFLNIAGDARANVLQRSRLSAFPTGSAIPGTLGYFQVDNAGRFSTPLLPEAEAEAQRYGIAANELRQRREIRNLIYKVLSDNHLVVKPAMRQASVGKAREADADPAGLRDTLSSDSAPPRVAASPAAENKSLAGQVAQSGFDQLQAHEAAKTSSKIQQNYGRVEDLKLEKRYAEKLAQQKRDAAESKPEPQTSKRTLRKEQNILPERPALTAGKKPAARINMFESEIDTFEFSVLDSGHFVLYRKVWRNGQRYIQGLLIEPAPFIDAVIKDAFNQAAVSLSSNLAVAYQGSVLSALSSRTTPGYLASADELQGTLLLQSRLSSPLNRMELIFSVNSLPAGAGGTVLTWTALVLLLVFTGGFYGMYRLGRRQILLARQQQDFVSAVSHELKTPLTSIRMYGEMLREGWATEEKRKTYYDYIYEESERLTRLINNVLQLARMSRNDLQVDLKPYTVAQLLDTIRSKVSSQLERAGFYLNIECDALVRSQLIAVDADYFTQVIINLVDNAIKFSAKAEQKQIDLHCQRLRDGKLQISVRDYGPGIPRDQLRKIFQLFYRLENELTRETVGTGIGLALVRQLVTAMRGSIDVVNQNPGAEFRMIFQVMAGGDA